MDQTQFATIVITAVVTTVIKEVCTWLFAVLKATATASTVSAALSRMFSKTNRAIVLDIVALLFYLTLLLRFASDAGPASRIDILLMAGATVGALVMVVVLLIDFAKARPPSPRR